MGRFSAFSGTCNSLWQISDIICAKALLRAPPRSKVIGLSCGAVNVSIDRRIEKAIPSITALAKWELVVEELTLKKLPAACETCTGNLSLVKYGKNNTPFSAGIVLRTIFSNVL